MKWQALNELPRGIAGLFVEGDPNVPPTRWWNHLYLLFWGWETVVVFQVDRSKDGSLPYRVGFRDSWGKTMLYAIPRYYPCFVARIGHEAVNP